ncbi:hypothetical protein [Kitasatospora griseola]|uniref:hypothetical protein n=1 Tax=Kitasatospora griseola TaxID=2064 RepID=UPI0034175A3C
MTTWNPLPMPADRPRRSVPELLATAAAAAVALASWAYLIAALGPDLRAAGFGPVEAWAAPALLPVLAVFALRQLYLLVPIGVLTMVLMHQAWHQQQDAVFGWGWWPALGEASCFLFLGVALPLFVDRMTALARAEKGDGPGQSRLVE